MNRIAEFKKVSLNQYLADCGPESAAVYQSVLLPRRATTGSAGYDFFAPQAIDLAPGETIRVATGIRAQIDPGWVLLLFPRSSLGFKYRLQLDNTVAVIDSDYYGAANEGHIFVKMTNLGQKPLHIDSGQAMCQGLFLPFGITVNDEAAGQRTGGLGSTDGAGRR